MIKLIPLAEYLQHAYVRPQILPKVPLADEAYVASWQRPAASVQALLQEVFQLPWEKFSWQQPEAMALSFTQTLGGRLPVISLQSHADFCCLVSLLAGVAKPQAFLPSVNACAITAKCPQIFGQRLLLLNQALYSNVAAEELGLTEADWLAKSQLLRLRHESAHYECLRLLGSMRNHLRDELVADILGQLAAFGDFKASRQRLFFGLTKGEAVCTGRLQHYCRCLSEADKGRLYLYADAQLEELEAKVSQWQQAKLSELEILLHLACD